VDRHRVRARCASIDAPIVVIRLRIPQIAQVAGLGSAAGA
jgi:hypothetical protein